MELVDMPDLGSGAVRCVGSSPFTRTKKSGLPRKYNRRGKFFKKLSVK